MHYLQGQLSSMPFDRSGDTHVRLDGLDRL